MNDVWPEFADKVDFYAIGQSRFESIEQLESDRKKERYPWPIATIEPDVLKDLRVLQQSTKIALDHQGIIAYRENYAKGGAEVQRPG
jgi:hypothetical protein